eukprot:14113944-Alexandrium_andersonii.AAC.1
MCIRDRREKASRAGQTELGPVQPRSGINNSVFKAIHPERHVCFSTETAGRSPGGMPIVFGFGAQRSKAAAP